MLIYNDLFDQYVRLSLMLYYWPYAIITPMDNIAVIMRKIYNV